jgi:hypothetical protein
MPADVNHASEVIFHDYHLILRYLAQLPRQKKRRRKRIKEDSVEVKAFFCSGVKASFR